MDFGLTQPALTVSVIPGLARALCSSGFLGFESAKIAAAFNAPVTSPAASAWAGEREEGCFCKCLSTAETASGGKFRYEGNFLSK